MPGLTLVPSLGEAEMHAQADAFWAAVADAAAEALTAVHPEHPHLPELRRLVAGARRAAGRPAVRAAQHEEGS